MKAHLQRCARAWRVARSACQDVDWIQPSAAPTRLHNNASFRFPKEASSAAVGVRPRWVQIQVEARSWAPRRYQCSVSWVSPQGTGWRGPYRARCVLTTAHYYISSIRSPSFYGIHGVIIVFARAFHRPLSWASSIQSVLPLLQVPLAVTAQLQCLQFSLALGNATRTAFTVPFPVAPLSAASPDFMPSDNALVIHGQTARSLAGGGDQVWRLRFKPSASRKRVHTDTAMQTLPVLRPYKDA
jgi:hypothetical protein